MKTYNTIKTAATNKGGGFIIASDKTADGKKQFSVLEKYSVFVELIEMEHKILPNHYYEIFEESNPWNYIVDLDIKKNDSEEYYVNPGTLIGLIQNHFKTSVEIQIGKTVEITNIVLKSPDTHIKKSFHLIFRIKDHFFKSYMDCKLFTEKYMSGFYPFLDKAIYTKNRCFRTLNSSKMGSPECKFDWFSTPLDTKLTLGSYTPRDNNTVLIEIKKCKKNKKVEAETSTFKDVLESEIIFLLDGLKEERCEDFNLWLNVGFILKGLDSQEGIKYFDYFSKKSNKYDKASVQKTYDSIVPDKNTMFSSLVGLYNKDNEKTYSNKKLTGGLTLNLDLECRDDILSRFIYSIYCCDYVCEDIEQKTWYSFNGVFWEQEDSNYNLRTKIISQIIPLFEKRREYWKEKVKTAKTETDAAIAEILKEQNNNICKKLGNEKTLTNTELFFKNVKFGKTKNMYPEFICFKNCIIDISTGEPVDNSPELFITQCIGMDYKENIEFDEINKFLDDVFLNPEIKHYALKVFASCLFGKNQEEHWYFLTGIGRNGKTILMKIFEKALGDYFTDGKIQALTEKRESSSSANSFMVKLKHKRVVVFQEPAKNDIIQIDILKQMTGDNISCRELYKKEEIITPMFKGFIVCNKVPKLSDVDYAISRRIRVIPFETVFKKKKDCKYETDREINYGFQKTEKQEELAEQLIHLLLKYYRDYYLTEGLSQEPKIIKDSTEEYLNSSDSIQQFISEFLIKDEDSMVSKSEIKEIYAFEADYKNTYKYRDFIREIERKIGRAFTRGKMKDGIRRNDVLIGYRVRTNDDQ